MGTVSWGTDPSLWRRRWHQGPGRSTPLRRPVISVGNLSMGGRGKSPLVAHLARLLLEAGERPAILSRGYGRRQADEGVVVVSDGRRLLADLDRSGDEPLMLARAVPGAAVVVSRDRVLAGQLAERLLGTTVHVLDDGFQHFALKRDLDLVVVSNDDLSDRALPFGRLRESAEALAAADAVILDGDVDRARVARVAPQTPMFVMRRTVGSPERLDPLNPLSPIDPIDSAWPPSAGDIPVVAVAGIVKPERFAESLVASGWQVARLVQFPDHHRYGVRDLEAIARAVSETGVRLVLTTAKDAVRLRPLRPLPFAVGVIPLDVAIEPAAEFLAWLRAGLRPSAS